MSREEGAGSEMKKRTGIEPVDEDFVIAGPRPPHPVRVPRHRARRFVRSGRNGRTRTFDLPDPNRPRYQTALRSENWCLPQGALCAPHEQGFLVVRGGIEPPTFVLSGRR